MKARIFLLATVCLASIQALGQAPVLPFSITSSQCAPIAVGRFGSAVAIQVTGTWTGTLQPQGVIQGNAAFNIPIVSATTNAAALTITANGVFVVPVAGFDFLLVCGNTVASGTAVVSLNLSQAHPSIANIPGLSSGAGAPAMSAPGSLQTAITGSNTGAAAAANVTLAGVAGKTTYITGFQITGAGATAASIISVTLTGTITGTMSYNIVVPAGATTSITPLVVSFPVPVPASAVNTAIVVNVPSFGAGNTNAAVSAQGFQQ